MLGRIAAVLTAVFLCSTAAAEEKRIVSGVGVSTCATFNKENAKNPNLTSSTYLSWAQGFIAARNLETYSADKSYRSLEGEIEDQYEFLVKYCKTRPDHKFANAVITLFQSFPEKGSK